MTARDSREVERTLSGKGLLSAGLLRQNTHEAHCQNFGEFLEAYARLSLVSLRKVHWRNVSLIALDGLESGCRDRGR